jgi:hypothetical protein
MTSCLECGEAYLAGALFCTECGAYLVSEDDFHQTMKSPFHEGADAYLSTRPLDYRLGFGIKADKIIFVIPSSGRRLSVNMADSISIGRRDARQGITPEVDLTVDEGADNGVSRAHAELRNSEEGVVLVDLGSTNGTRINDWQLYPERPELLKEGDTVRFGRLLVQIHFET